MTGILDCFNKHEGNEYSRKRLNLMDKKIKKRKFLRGFTVIEILVIIAVMGIMLSIAFVNLSSGRTGAKLDAAQREVASAVQTAKSNALQGKTASGSVPKCWGFKFTDNDTYIIFPSDCSTDGSSVETSDLGNGVKLKSPSPANSKILFSVPNGGVTLAAASPTAIELEIPGVTPTKTVSVTSPGGVITEN